MKQVKKMKEYNLRIVALGKSEPKAKLSLVLAETLVYDGGKPFYNYYLTETYGAKFEILKGLRTLKSRNLMGAKKVFTSEIKKRKYKSIKLDPKKHKKVVW